MTIEPKKDAEMMAKKIEALERARDHAFRTCDLFGVRANDERARAEAAEAQLAAVTRELDAARAAKEITEKLLGGSLYTARMALQRRAEAAEAKLAARDAEVTRLRDASESVLSAIQDKGRLTSALVCSALEDLRAALEPTTKDAREKEEGS